MKIYLRQILIISTLIISYNINGQNTVSPYSIFGPGEIQSGGFGTNKGMGGAGIALESGNHLNNLNPSSYAGIDSLRLIVEFGIEGKAYGITTSRESVSGFNGNLAYLALGFKYTPWFAGSLGLVPFSSVGYTIERSEFVEGMDHQYDIVYKGSGGISQFYFTNAVKIMKRLSLGINTSFLFGPLTQQEYILPTEYVPELMIERTDLLISTYFDFGLQYRFAGEKREYSIGLTYAHEQSLNSRHGTTVYDKDANIVGMDLGDADYLVIPEIIGTGIGLKTKNYSLALDYTFQNWSGVQYPIQNEEFNDSHKVVFGGEINPWRRSAHNSFYKNWTYRFGISYEASYLKYNGSTVQDKNITLGFGIPMYNKHSKVDFSVTGGVNGAETSHSFKEKYLMFNLGFNLNEFAFMKRKID